MATLAQFSLNVMFLTYDADYLVRDEDFSASHELQEFILSDPSWMHDDARLGWVRARVVLPPAADDPPPETM